MNDLIQKLKGLASWEDRYKEIIRLGKLVPDIPAELKIDRNKVSGCQSVVYLTAESNDNKIKFQAWSEALIVNGLIYLLLEFYNNQPADFIIKTEPSFVSEIGLAEHLSASRSNGLRSMIKQIKLYAFALSNQAKLK